MGRTTPAAATAAGRLAGAVAVVVVLVAAAVSGDWDVLLGLSAALLVLVPLFWMLHHPRRRRHLRLVLVDSRA